MAFAFELEPIDMVKEIYWVDLSIFKPDAQKYKFYQLQKLAFSKGVCWCGTGDNLEPYSMLKSEMGDTKVVIYISNGYWGKYLSYGKEGTQIDYRSLIKRLRVL